jgi:hypothetical protein
MRKKQVQPAGAVVPVVFLRRADRIQELAEGVKHADARAGLLHLADLYRHCPRFYPNLNIRESDGLPMKASSSVAGFGSPGAMCMEG